MAWSWRGDLNPPRREGESEWALLNRRYKAPHLAHIRFLFADYHPSAYYFESVDLSRKLCLIIISVFFMPGSSTQLVALFVYTITYALFLFRRWPYLAESDNVYVRSLIIVHSANGQPSKRDSCVPFTRQYSLRGAWAPSF